MKKDIPIKEQIKKVEVLDETYIFYQNKTNNNITQLQESLIKDLKGLKTQIIESNNTLLKSERLKADYFDFYIKYKHQIKFLEYLSERKVFLQSFEKKYILGRLWYNEKIFNSIKLNRLVEFKISDTLLGEKKIVLDKDKEVIRIQTFDEDEQIWMNIYYGEIGFFNIDNEYIYNMDFLDIDENNVYGIIYVITKDFNISHHYLNIEYKDNIITKIKNIDMYNNINGKFLDTDCNQKLKYLSVNAQKTKLSIYCRDSQTGLMKTKTIINNNK